MAAALLGGCAGPDETASASLRIETRPAVEPEASRLTVAGHPVRLEATVRSSEHFPPQELEGLARRETVFLECPLLSGATTRPAVLWLPLRGRDDLRERFAVVSLSRTAVDPHYPLVWIQAGALVLEVAPCELRPEIAAAAARALAERFALSADRIGLEVHVGPWDEAPGVLGPLREGGSFPFGFGLQVGGEGELEALLSAGVPSHHARVEGVPPRDLEAAVALHRPRLEFVDATLGRWAGSIEHVVEGVVAGRRARVRLRARPNEVEAMARRALEDGDRVFAETDSLGAALDAMHRRLDGLGLEHALVHLGEDAATALGPAPGEPAFPVMLPSPTIHGGLTPFESLRNGAMVVEGGVFDPLPAMRFVCVFAPTARRAEALARRCREVPSEQEAAALFEEEAEVHAWMLLGDEKGMRWRRVPEQPRED